MPFRPEFLCQSIQIWLQLADTLVNNLAGSRTPFDK
jgi:hypothetical protein